MKKLTDKELSKIEGGVSAWVGVAIAAAVVFISGVVEGIAHPRACDE